MLWAACRAALQVAVALQCLRLAVRHWQKEVHGHVPGWLLYFASQGVSCRQWHGLTGMHVATVPMGCMGGLRYGTARWAL